MKPMYEFEEELFEKTRHLIRRIKKKQDHFAYFCPDYIADLECSMLLVWLREYKRLRNKGGRANERNRHKPKNKKSH